MKKRLITILLLGMGACLLMSGCSKKEEDPPAIPEPEVVIEETTKDTDTEDQDNDKDQDKDSKPEENPHKGKARSFLTGKWIKEDLAKKRPLSCMIGNTAVAQPQYGIGQAEVIFEAPVEGRDTRLMGIFQNYKKLEKLGSVRSGRLYFAYYSMGFDAIYLHYGQASYAESFLKSGQIDDLNCMEYQVDQAIIYRDTSLRAPHNAYATGKGIQAGIELKQYGTEYGADYKGYYQFAKDGKRVKLKKNAKKVAIVQPGYLINKPYFEYNPKDHLYYRYQHGTPHVDGTDNSQLAVSNIILQYSNVRALDEKDYLEIGTTGEGSGQFVTNGKAIDITWKCEDNFSPIHYYDREGKEITLNQGKTWVCIIDNSYLDRVQVYADASQMQ